MGRHLESLRSLNIAGAKARLNDMTANVSTIKVSSGTAESDVVLKETVPRLGNLSSEISNISTDLDSLYSQLSTKADQYDKKEAEELARRLAEQNKKDSEDDISPDGLN